MILTGYTANTSKKTGATYVTAFQEAPIPTKDGKGTRVLEVRCDEDVLPQLKKLDYPCEIDPDLEAFSVRTDFGPVTAYRLVGIK